MRDCHLSMADMTFQPCWDFMFRILFKHTYLFSMVFGWFWPGFWILDVVGFGFSHQPVFFRVYSPLFTTTKLQSGASWLHPTTTTWHPHKILVKKKEKSHGNPMTNWMPWPTGCLKFPYYPHPSWCFFSPFLMVFNSHWPQAAQPFSRSAGRSAGAGRLHPLPTLGGGGCEKDGIWWGRAVENGFGMISGWWFGTFFIFPYIGNLIIPIDVHIFQRGSNHQPDFIYISWTLKNKRLSSTTNGDFKLQYIYTYIYTHMILWWWQVGFGWRF